MMNIKELKKACNEYYKTSPERLVIHCPGCKSDLIQRFDINYNWERTKSMKCFNCMKFFSVENLVKGSLLKRLKKPGLDREELIWDGERWLANG